MASKIIKGVQQRFLHFRATSKSGRHLIVETHGGRCMLAEN